jgi:CheY-like chemotaxis protein
MWRKSVRPLPSIEEVRKQARVLVVDDMQFPHQRTFERDGYHFERWAKIKNLSQLTDGHFDLILLDVQGVGLDESPDLQGLGILRHIKRSNPAQPVIIYSAQPHRISSSELVRLADVVLDKSVSYVEYKEEVDDLLLRRVTPGYFIAAMNKELGEDAALVPRAVGKALRTMRRGESSGLEKYLRGRLSDEKKIDRLLTIVSIGTSAIGLLS